MSVEAESVGKIGLDLVVNKNDFEKQMSGIKKLAANAGKALAAAFAVKKLVDFGKECVNLGSDLEEVQNVVDVTFPNMSKQVDEFATKAAKSFGLSETMTKQFMGTFGSMAKAFGFAEKEAFAMSTTLTGLAGDVASFYNLSNEEAYNKLKAVFTGETEGLKSLGVVMTQTALDSFALENGFGKATKTMSEAEKVALRYAFVQKQLNAAAGDFSRTSDGWANQIRILTLQFDSLKATIGQGLINVLTPVIKVINVIIGKLMSLANAFKAFTEMLTGKKVGSDATAKLQQTAAAADGVAAATEGIGDAAAGAAKKMKGLYAFDDMKVVNQDSGSGGGSGGGGYSVDSFDMGELSTDMEEVDSKYQALINKAKELKDIFTQGFWKGFGDISIFDSINASLGSIKSSLLDIITDSEVLAAAERDLDSFVKNIGVKIGSLASIGASIADNLLGGLASYLAGNEERIKNHMIAMFDLDANRSEIYGNLWSALATVFESLRSDGAVRITSALIGAFSDAFMGARELCTRLGTDLLDVITAPFIDNQDKIKEALEKTFTAIAPVFESIKDLVDEISDTLNSTYEEHIHPLFISLRDGLAEIGEKLLGIYEEYILPVIQGLSAKFAVLKSQYLDPLVSKLGETIGKIADAVNAVWTNALKPALEEAIEKWGPVIGETLRWIGQVFFDVSAAICTVLDGFMTALGGLMDFITGVFTGDWEKAWDGIKTFFSGIWSALFGIAENLTHAISDAILAGLSLIADYFQVKFDWIRDFVSQTFVDLKTNVSSGITSIHDKLKSVLNLIQTIWKTIWTNMKTTVVNIFDGIWNAIKKVINSIIGGIEKMANSIIKGINSMIGALKRLSFDVPEWVPEIGGKSLGFNITEMPEINIPRLKNGGFVRANTPQLAMIGDNRHQGEIVAPEDKIYQIGAQATKDALRELISELRGIMSMSRQDTTIVLRVSGEMAPLVRLLKVYLDKEASREGINFGVVYE